MEVAIVALRVVILPVMDVVAARLVPVNTETAAILVA